uniref:Uncharacterized protein n=1 Tax=Romanomermis culicivorax TaxID=13658 RepID=A0A915HJ86_ROMCU
MAAKCNEAGLFINNILTSLMSLAEIAENLARKMFESSGASLITCLIASITSKQMFSPSLSQSSQRTT